MRKLIRLSVFETNSSSTHSVSFAGPDKEFVIDTIYPDQNGKIFVSGGEFGWEWAKYNDAVTKLNYAYQDRVDIGLLRRTVKNQTGAIDVIFLDKEEGNIDHQSSGTARDICVDEESTRNFIFNKNTWLFTGNDNGTPDPTFYHIPEIRNGRIIVPQYKYELIIEGLEKTTKFLEYPNEEQLEDGIHSLLDDLVVTEDGHFLDNTDIYFQIMRQRNMFAKKIPFKLVEIPQTIGFKLGN